MKNDRPPPDDRWAGESFTFRRMRPWQIWTMTGVVAVLVIGSISLYYM